MRRRIQGFVVLATAELLLRFHCDNSLAALREYNFESQCLESSATKDSFRGLYGARAIVTLPAHFGASSRDRKRKGALPFRPQVGLNSTTERGCGSKQVCNSVRVLFFALMLSLAHRDSKAFPNQSD